VVVDESDDTSEAARKFVDGVQVQGFTWLAGQGRAPEPIRDELLLLSVGAPVYLKISQPDLFKNASLEPFPMNDPRPVLASDNGGAREIAESKLDQLMREKFVHSPGTRKKLLGIETDLRTSTGSFSQMSDREIKSEIVGRFWKPAQAQVAQWADLEIVARNRQSPPPAKVDAFKMLTQRPGHGLVFVSEKHFADLKKDAMKYCKKEIAQRSN